MQKSYADHMNEISAEQLYEGLLAHGMFAEKLPPIFTSEPFFDYCNNLRHNFSESEKQFVYYESIRNINTPRSLGIPNPMGYQRLCRCLADNWDKLQQHFASNTRGQTHKASRIHLRKLANQKCLFAMNYNNWRIDDSPEPELLLGKRYFVSADISNCFPSIYTHSLPWGLIGKCHAKMNRNKTEWFNKIDHCCQQIKTGETHGLLIGPHASNLLSELILTVVDKNLYDRGWRFVRWIDDYNCYVSSYEAGQQFLVDLSEELRHFDLSLNHKKTSIQELPIPREKLWKRNINSISLITKHGKVDFKVTQSFLDSAVELMRNNNMDSAVLNYAIKTLSSQPLTDNAKIYFTKTVLHLAIIFPYLIPLLDEYLFTRLSVSQDEIIQFSQMVFMDGLKGRNFEAACFALYFALKYNFTLQNLDATEVAKSGSCIYAVLAFKYFEKQGDTAAKKVLRDFAKALVQNNDDFERNWLFAYEVLSKSDLKGDWKPMKQAKVSFLRQI